MGTSQRKGKNERKVWDQGKSCLLAQLFNDTLDCFSAGFGYDTLVCVGGGDWDLDKGIFLNIWGEAPALTLDSHYSSPCFVHCCKP